MAAKVSTAMEHSFTPNTPVASNTTGISEEVSLGRCTSKAITFLPATAPDTEEMMWNAEKTGPAFASIDCVSLSKFSSRLKRATLRPFTYTTTPPVYFTRTFSTE